MNREQVFHKNRIAFAIIDGKVLFLMDSALSHEEWLVGSNIVSNLEFNKITRGFVKGEDVYFYKGDFKTGVDVKEDALMNIKQICLHCKIKIPSKLYCGMNRGDIGSLWTPIEELNILLE